MAYIKTEWKARQGTGLNRFTKSQETGMSVVLTNAPEDITEPGTSFTAERMNHIEDGIGDAHEAIEAEAEARAEADENLAGIITENDIRLAEAYQGLNRQFEEYRFITEYLIQFVESKHGPLGGAFPLIIESGEYLVTENGDFLVTA
jgi:hypothetical protein